MAVYMTEEEKEILPKIISTAMQIPVSKQEYVLGYMQAVVDLQSMEAGDNGRRNERANA